MVDTAKLADLKALFDAGALTQEEFDEAKKEVIAASRNSSPVLDRQPDRRSEHGEPVFSPVGGLPTTGATQPIIINVNNESTAIASASASPSVPKPQGSAA